MLDAPRSPVDMRQIVRAHGQKARFDPCIGVTLVGDEYLWQSLPWKRCGLRLAHSVIPGEVPYQPVASPLDLDRDPAGALAGP